MPGYEEKAEASAAVVQRGSGEVQAEVPLQDCKRIQNQHGEECN
jgi:hypothetical protein